MHPRRCVHVALIAIMFAVPVSFAHVSESAGQNGNVTSRSEFLNIILKITSPKADDSDEIKLRLNGLAAVRKPIAVIFIPGVLGSQLVKVDGNKVIWGDGSPDGREIVLKDGDKTAAVRAEVLDSYKTFFGMIEDDIYGNFLNLFKGGLAGHANVVKFAFDWRQDLRDSAKKLDDFLRTDARVKDRGIYLVGHSMGGLLAWTWQGLHYKGFTEDDLDVVRLVTLGAPLQGACEFFRLLKGGYDPGPEASTFEKSAYRFIFKELQIAAFTFPGVFQLLPRDTGNGDESCLPIRQGDDPEKAVGAKYLTTTGAKDLSETFWASGLGKLLFDNVKGDAPEKLGMSEKEFAARFFTVLRAADEFRNQIFPGHMLNVRTVMYAGRDQTTIEKIIVADPENANSVESFVPGPSTHGDGRVMINSAQNSNNWTTIKNMAERPRKVFGKHGDLPKARLFRYWFSDNARNVSAEYRMYRAVKIILEDDELFGRYIDAGGRKIITSAWISTLGPPQPAKLRKIIDRFNMKIVAKTEAVKFTDKDFWLFDAASGIQEVLIVLIGYPSEAFVWSEGMVDGCVGSFVAWSRNGAAVAVGRSTP